MENPSLIASLIAHSKFHRRLQRVEHMSSGGSNISDGLGVSNPAPQDISADYSLSPAQPPGAEGVQPVSILKRPDGPGTPGVPEPSARANASANGDSKQVSYIIACD